MIEDDIYRTSSQYRLWSFTSASLTSLRASTNSLASDRVKAAIRRAQDQKTSISRGDAAPNGGVDENGVHNKEKSIDCLTVEEEGKLLRYYCEATLQTAENYRPRKLATNVWATAIQFLRRFYLTNSPMTYHPKQVMPCALFLATKTENHFTILKDFASQLDKTSPEDVLAPEFLLTQGLRFTFDVRHPFRGLDGGIMELSAIADGDGLPISATQPRSARDLKAALERLEHPSGAKVRIGEAHNTAKELLKSAAQMTDAYFLYTPSQIWLACLLIADEPLTRFYLDVKIPPAIPELSTLRPKLLATISSCAELLNSYVPSSNSKEELKDLKRIAKKLYQCQNPESVNLKEMNKAQKRDGAGAGGNDSDAGEKALKKRKVEREKLARDGDVFGGELKK